MISRPKQKLGELDYTLELYMESGTIFNDYRVNDDSFWACCDYDFCKHLQVGDEFHLTNEETHNLSPVVNTIVDDEYSYATQMLVVTRKIYSPTGLDIYVVLSEADLIY